MRDSRRARAAAGAARGCSAPAACSRRSSTRTASSCGGSSRLPCGPRDRTSTSGSRSASTSRRSCGSRSGPGAHAHPLRAAPRDWRPPSTPPPSSCCWCGRPEGLARRAAGLPGCAGAARPVPSAGVGRSRAASRADRAAPRWCCSRPPCSRLRGSDDQSSRVLECLPIHDDWAPDLSAAAQLAGRSRHALDHLRLGRIRDLALRPGTARSRSTGAVRRSTPKTTSHCIARRRGRSRGRGPHDRLWPRTTSGCLAATAASSRRLERAGYQTQLTRAINRSSQPAAARPARTNRGAGARVLPLIRWLERSVGRSCARSHCAGTSSGPWLAFVALLMVAPTYSDVDLWGHTRFGLDFLRTWTLSRADPYSFLQGHDWINHEWLSEAAMGLAFLGGGRRWPCRC